MSYRTNPGSPPELKALDAIAKTFALPHEYPPMRLPSFPALERTAVMSFNATTNYPVVATATGSSRGLLFRQAGTPLWLEQDSSAVYGIQIPLNPYSGGNSEVPDGVALTAFTGPTTLSSEFSVVNGVASPTYGPLMGIDTSTGPQQWIYVPSGWAIGVSVFNTAVGVADPLQAQFDMWTKPGEFISQGAAFTLPYLGGGSTTSSYGGVNATGTARWLRLAAITCPGALSNATRQVTATIIVGPNLTLSFTTKVVYTVGASRRGLLPVPCSSAYAFSTLPFRNTRVTAAAVLFTNVSKVLNKEGTVQAARLNPEADFPWNFSATSFDGIHPAEKYFYGLEKGFYTYSAPSTDLANFWDYSSVGVESVYGRYYPIHRLDNTALVNSFLFNDPDGDSSLAVNVDWHIEFRNTSTLWPIGVSAVSLEVLHSSQIALMQAGFFFDNVDHKWILAKIVKAANFLRPAISLHPVGAAAYKMLDAMTKTTKSTPAPTSLQARAGGRGPPRKRANRQRKKKPSQPAPKPRAKMASGLQMFLDSRRK